MQFLIFSVIFKATYFSSFKLKTVTTPLWFHNFSWFLQSYPDPCITQVISYWPSVHQNLENFNLLSYGIYTWKMLSLFINLAACGTHVPQHPVFFSNIIFKLYTSPLSFKIYRFLFVSASRYGKTQPIKWKQIGNIEQAIHIDSLVLDIYSFPLL